VTHRIERNEDGTVTRLSGSFFPEDLDRFARTLDKATYVCVEASSGVFEFYERIEPFVKKVIIIHPNGFRRMYLTGKKNDKVDAKNLADRLKAHIEDGDAQDDFPSVWVPPAGIRELRELFGCLDLLKIQITMFKNRIRSVLRMHMSPFAQTVDIEILAVGGIGLPETAAWEVKLLQGQLLGALEAKKQTEDRIKRTAVAHDESTVKLLVTVYGVSIMGSSALLADAGTIDRFKTAKKFCRYMRSAPRVDSSNELTRIGHIDKAGRKTAFGYLVEGLINIYGGNPNWARFYQTKTAGKSKCKVRAAIVRKTLVTVYYMWKNREAYRFVHDAATRRKLKEVERIKKSLAA
jgi:transposase